MSRFSAQGSFDGGAPKGAAKWACGETVVQHLKMDNKLSTKSSQVGSPREIHTYWFKATCDSKSCALEVSEQKMYSL